MKEKNINCCYKCPLGELDYIPEYFTENNLPNEENNYQREIVLVKCPFEEKNYKLTIDLCNHEQEKERVEKLIRA